MKRKHWFFGSVFLLALVLDQVTKIWARGSLKGHAPIVLIQDYFDLRFSENPGASFGMLRDFEYARWVLFGFGLIALGVIFYFLRKLPADRGRVAAELGLLAGGAVGNFIDRVAIGKVTDFIVWKVKTHEWPTFNIADAALVVGVIALLLDTRGDEFAGDPRPAAEAGKPTK